MMGKRLLVCLLILCMLLTCCGCKSEAEKSAAQAKDNWENTSNEARMGIYCALIKEYMLLVEDFGDATPYPAMNRSVKGNMMTGGLTQDEALSNAKEIIVKEQAIFWYADQAGISATDAEVAGYVQKYVLDEIQDSESYAAVDAICAKEGITYEETVWAYEDSYKMQYILIQSGVSAEQEIEFVEEIIGNYKETKAYKKLAVVLENCARLIADGETDKETIKASDIYYH